MTPDSSGAAFEDATAAKQISLRHEDSEFTNAVDTILCINPSFNFHFSDTLLVDLSISGIRKTRKLIKRGAENLEATFTIHDDDWKAEGSREVEFTISPSPWEPLHVFETYIPLSSPHDEGSDIFHEALSQLQAGAAGQDPSDASSNSDAPKEDEGLDLPTTVDGEFGHVEQDDRMDVPAVVDGELERSDRDESPSGDDDMARLKRATRPIFKQQSQTDYDALSARLPAKMTAMSAMANTRRDINIADDSDHDMDLLQVNTTSIVRGNVRKVSGSIGGHFSSGKSNSDDYDMTDVDDGVAEFDSDIRPTSFTTSGNPRKRSQTYTPDSGASTIEGMASRDAPANEKESESGDDLPKRDAVPLTEAQKVKRDKEKQWNAAGGRLKRRLLNHAAENDNKLRNGPPWEAPAPRSVKKFGTDKSLNAANVHILKIIEAQVELHGVLIHRSVASAAADIRRGLPLWKEDAVDDYERQLSAAIETARSYRLANPAASARLPTIRNSGSDLDDASSQPGETGMPDSSPTLDLQVRIPASYTGTKRGREAFEDIDDDELPDVESIGPRTSRATPLRNDEAVSAETLAKKARGSIARLS